MQQNATPRDDPGPGWRLLAALCLAVVALVLGTRILAPSDLNQNQDQSKTIAFTLDAAVNGNWALPRDGSGELTRKPPLVNWIGAVPVLAGWHAEPALKLPSVLAGVGTVVAAAVGGLVLFRRLGDHGSDAGDAALARHAPACALAAGAVWIACPSSIKHVYFMRPDMLFTLWLTIGWASATVLVTGPTPKRPRTTAVVMWTAAGLAALTKGPMALLIPAYALLAGLLIADHPERAHWRARASRTARVGWWWGVPLMLAMPGGWLLAAWRADPAHVEGVLLGQELGSRVPGSGESGALAKIWYALHRGVPGLLFSRFAPWGVLTILAVITKPSRAWLGHPTGPASLWVVMVLVVNVLTAGRSGSYLMPAYPAAGILAVYALARIIAGREGTRMRAAPAWVALAALLVAACVGGREAFFSRAARTGDGETLKAFARDAEALVGDDPVVFIRTGDLPLASLMGRAQAGEPDASSLAGAVWLVVAGDLGPIPAAVSKLESAPVLLPGRPGEDRSGQRATIRLLRAGPNAPTPP
ncbi:MAG: hypothetical protein DHS20C14_14270 [Phycisphaeraceae bacterium]|nr:MAG: hypothetical protein DHS20C14_14270 [Phycisphaeraceae bacterium]